MSSEEGLISFEGKRKSVSSIAIVFLTAAAVGLAGFAVFEYVQILNLKNEVTEIQIKQNVAAFAQPNSVQKVLFLFYFKFSCFLIKRNKKSKQIDNIYYIFDLKFLVIIKHRFLLKNRNNSSLTL